MSIFHGALIVISLAGALACGSSSDAQGSATAAASATTTPAPSQAPTAAPKPADDLDVAPLETSLKCPAAADPCRVLSAFKAAKGWSGLSPGGEGRYLGRFYSVKSGKVEESYAVLRTRTVPAAEAGAGRVPARLALAPIPKDDKAGSAFEKAIKAFERKDVPAKGSPAFELVKQLTTFTDLSAMPTVSGRVVVLGDDHTFVALGPAQEILVVAPKPTGGTSGDGVYAVLYPMSW